MLPFSYAYRNLIREPGRFLQKAGGSALVILLIIAAGSFNSGMNGLLQASGSPDNVIFLGAGSEESVERSQISMQSESMITAGVRGISERAGVSAVSGEVHYNGMLGIPGVNPAQGLTRGVTPAVFEVHQEARLLEGRWPASGEVIVGRLAHHLIGVGQDDLAVGNILLFEGEEFRISGRFDAEGTVMESEVWFNRSDLMTLIQRETLSCVVIRLDDPADLKRADLFAKQRLDLELVVVSESEYYANLSAFYGPIRSMTWLTAAMVAVGAIMGGLNMLYASFSARVRELATLQTLGYRRRSVLLSLIQESLFTQAVGLVLAVSSSLLLLDGTMVQFSMGTFRMELTGTVLLVGFITALLLGTIGTLPPAIRCLRMPVPTALRSG
ncbi:ABC transporter permease [Puniceicoccales bacterium CK1056]|uniref:ABC transporter permease n=1 Tax=Oceanipulchritudo coccoides TaxID=2706888 RepID=A0A6B2M4Z4_9BACT|nr:ABC transporter permease [Oceanipulchritudo coccoides]NDV62915.1 ABC transporter permease [Oceanipulchritudo coccoides]